jgi:biotin carboxylase
MNEPSTILALASEYKGAPFLQECKRQGCRVLVVMNQNQKSAPWPWDCIDEHFAMPDIRKRPDILYGIAYLARTRRIDRIVALDDFDVETAAALREHMRLDGMGDSLARRFRDKLAMRVGAQRAGIAVPTFTGLFHDAAINRFLDEVPPPWVLKPRMLAGSEGIRLFHKKEELWQFLNGLGDQRSSHLIERFVPGDVFHVDALTWDGQVVFGLASKYDTPPMAALQGQKIFITRTLPHEDGLAQDLLRLNQAVLSALGYEQGASHTEFIRGQDGKIYFLETAARVGGGNIERLVEGATGIAPWREVARIELCALRGETYAPPPVKREFGGLLACPNRARKTDVSAYNDPEIVFRAAYGEFAYFVVSSPRRERVDELLANYASRVGPDFMTKPA